MIIAETETWQAKKAATEVHARNMMDKHGLTDWTFGWDRARRRSGQCNYRRKRITLSEVVTPQRTALAIHNTILHEIAHALVGSHHGHNHVWKAKARAIGCTGDRCSRDHVEHDYTYIGTCPNCNRKSGRFRRPKDARACGVCCRLYNRNRFDQRFVIVWTRNN